MNKGMDKLNGCVWLHRAIREEIERVYALKGKLHDEVFQIIRSTIKEGVPVSEALKSRSKQLVEEMTEALGMSNLLSGLLPTDKIPQEIIDYLDKQKGP